MAIVKAKRVRPVGTSESKREIYAEVCYFYPQYTLAEVQKLPARDIQLLLRVAKKQEALKMYNYLQIATAPHTKKGEGVKKLSEYFKKEYEK